jgi:hypothetical protein
LASGESRISLASIIPPFIMITESLWPSSSFSSSSPSSYSSAGITG